MRGVPHDRPPRRRLRPHVGGELERRRPPRAAEVEGRRGQCVDDQQQRDRVQRPVVGQPEPPLDDALPGRVAGAPAGVLRVDPGAEPLQQRRDLQDLPAGGGGVEALLDRRQVGRRDLALDLARLAEVAVHAEQGDPLDLGAVLVLHQAGRDRRTTAAHAHLPHPDAGGSRARGRQEVGTDAERVRLADVRELGAHGVAGDREHVAAVDTATHHPPLVEVRVVETLARTRHGDAPVELVVHGSEPTEDGPPRSRRACPRSTSASCRRG